MTSTRILIVEDEGIVASDIERQLIRLGYEAAGIASTGEEAIALAERTRPQLVLMDIHLAGAMDGIDAATTIRTRFSIPSVFLTAYATDDVVERAKRAEPLGYLIKPFDQHSLRTTVEIALHKDQLDFRLHQSEARYRAVIQSANDAIVTSDSAGMIVGWSPAATRLFGYTESEITGQPVARLMDDSTAAQHDRSIGRLPVVSQGNDFSRVRELEARRKDGAAFPAEVSLATWMTTEGQFVTAFIRDISERKRAEATQRLQSAALNAAANAIIITNSDGVIEWANPAFITTTGYTLEESIGHNPRELVKSGIHDAEFYREMWRVLVAGEVWVGELTNRRKDGSLCVEEQTITPLKQANGQITHYIGVKRDLTDQKRMQEQFLQAQKMEVVGRLAGGIAHDFNNLLTVINGRSDLALGDLPADDPLRPELLEIREAGERAARLTKQLLTFSRKQVGRPVVLNLSTQVAASGQILRRLIGEDIKFVIHGPQPPGLDNVLADRSQIEQVLLNLAVNARDAMPKGGTLTVDVRNVELDETEAATHAGLKAGPHVLLSMADTGTGMSADVRSHLFEPFFTTKGHNKGTGLGLATVHGIVAEHHGAISVSSEAGHGATFTVLLPRVAGTAAPLVDASEAVPGTESILIAEDERALRNLTVRMLKASGYSVVTADSGLQALGEIDRPGAHFDLLLTDVIMPGMSGPDLAAEILATNSDIRVLFMSGYTDEKVLSGAAEDAGYFIPKPYTAAELTRAIRRVLDTPPTLKD